jgi:hypothetical protein
MGPFEADHLWHYDYKEKIENEENEDDEVERWDFGKFAEDDSYSKPEEYEIFEPEGDLENDEFYVNYAGCDREIEGSIPLKLSFLWIRLRTSQKENRSIREQRQPVRKGQSFPRTSSRRTHSGPT